MKKIFIMLTILIGLVFAGCSNTNMQDTTNNTNPLDTQVKDNTNSVQVNINGYNYRFEDNDIILKVGVPVTLTFTSQEGFHDLISDELGIATQRLNQGERDEIFITPEEIGEFEFYCSVGNHREQGMVGIIRVIE
jgi:plastocyanin